MFSGWKITSFAVFKKLKRESNFGYATGII